MTPKARAARECAVAAPLEACGLAVGRAGAPVLRDVDLAIAPGERVALIGANGSGKTTLLRALAGVDAPLSGLISWTGGPLARGPERVRTLGVVFQREPASAFTVRELVTLGLGLEDRPSRAQAERVDAALEAWALTALADRPSWALSGGEAQRALLARALVARPRLLLLDEPTSHLDPARQAELLGELDRLRGEVAVVLATHDLALAMTADRVALLAGGTLGALGPPDEVLTPDHLARALGVRVRRVDDPAGGLPLLRVLSTLETRTAR